MKIDVDGKPYDVDDRARKCPLLWARRDELGITGQNTAAALPNVWRVHRPYRGTACRLSLFDFRWDK